MLKLVELAEIIFWLQISEFYNLVRGKYEKT